MREPAAAIDLKEPRIDAVHVAGRLGRITCFFRTASQQWLVTGNVVWPSKDLSANGSKYRKRYRKVSL